MIEQLNRSSIPPARAGELIAPVDRPQSLALVHLGLGAFARAHPIQYTERASEITGDRSWGVLGVTGRKPNVAEALAPQGGLYGVLVRSATEDLLKLTGSLLDVAAAGNSKRVVDAITAPGTQIVTLTITEKAYRTDLLSTPLMLLRAGLLQRFRTGGAPITIMSCDNLVNNGRVLESLVKAEIDDAPFVRWLADSVRFPCSMVDRIVPATTVEDRRIAERISRRSDAGLVVAEPFMQWVIEDDFAADRPEWDRAGAVFTRDVAPYEAAKLRLLNGTHSLLAYAGALAGHRTIADAVSDPELAARARQLQRDARATLVPVDGVDLEEYSDQVLRRFANPALRHTTRQVAMDGSQKLSMRIVNTCADALRVGTVPGGGVFAVASWIAYVARVVGYDPGELDDPMAGRLSALVKASQADTMKMVRSFLALGEIFPEVVRFNEEFVSAVADQVDAAKRSSIGTPNYAS